ncbi:MAG: alpha/beta hydrolase [Myxococcota bacterium]
MPSVEHEAVVESLNSQRGTDTPATAEEMRASFEAMAGYFEALEFPSEVKQDPVDAGGVPGVWFTPPDARWGCAILYLHGGGYVVGSVATHRSLIARIARASGVRCLAIDYRLAPEHAFPAAVEDARSAYRWLLAQGIGATGLVIAGDSAGGGLALGSIVALREANDPLPAAAICLSPLADLEVTGDSARGGVDDPMVSQDGIVMMAEAYLQGGDLHDPRAAPLHADFSGFPPLLIQVGTREILLDDAKRVTASARAAGVDVVLEEGEGLTHVWQLYPHVPESIDAVERIGRFVLKQIG